MIPTVRHVKEVSLIVIHIISIEYSKLNIDQGKNLIQRCFYSNSYKVIIKTMERLMDGGI